LSDSDQCIIASFLSQAFHKRINVAHVRRQSF
jgi:hypothetical protein